MSLKLTAHKNAFIEQIRGIAILLVLAFHYTDRIPPGVMGSEASPLILFEHGSIGVYIFFVLSGFLIAKTMQNSATLSEFYGKRLSRIWPLFIVSNVIVFLWVLALPTPVVPEGVRDFDVTGRSVSDLIGTSFFLKDFGFEWIDGVHWSILVELKYYFIVGLFAAAFRHRYTDAFTLAALAIGAVEFLAIVNDFGLVNKVLHGLLISQYLVFFAVGMRMYQTKYDLLMLACICLIVAQMMQAAMNNPDFNLDALLLFCVFFAVFLVFDMYAASGRICQFFGHYSYSIYLFHQAIGLSIILMLTPALGIDLAILIALVAVVALSVAASAMFEWRFRVQTAELLIRLGDMAGLKRFKIETSGPDLSGKEPEQRIIHVRP